MEPNNERLNINPEHFRNKIPHLSVVNGKAQIDPKSPQHQKWFEVFKRSAPIK